MSGSQQRFLVAYFVLVLVSVGIAALVLLVFPARLPTPIVLLLASWLPNTVGVALTARADGRAGLRQLFSRAVRWRFSGWWYAVALVLPVAAVMVAIGFGGVVGIQAPRFITNLNVLIPLFVLNFLAGPLGEELGWRGFALPKLQARWGALSSSLMLGIAWWSFHTPGFALGLFPAGFTPVVSLIGAIALTILITWMFNNTGGSLIPGSLMHLSINFVTAATGVSDSPQLYALTTSVLVLGAAIVVLLYGRERLMRRRTSPLTLAQV